MKSEYKLSTDDIVSDRPRGKLSRAELIMRGLFFAPWEVVDMQSFCRMHRVELPDGRRFRSEECALAGLEFHQAGAVRAFWEAKGE